MRLALLLAVAAIVPLFAYGFVSLMSLQRSTHYSRSAYTGDGHPYMRECWRNQ